MVKLENVQPVLEAIRNAGGISRIVGGFVRDSVLGIDSKDIDIEVYKMTSDQLAAVLSRFGKSETVGASYGVMKLWMGGQDYDFTLPRRDNKCGRNHKDFTVEIDPNMSFQEAASRRDFTFNSIAMNPFTSQIEDPFSGLDDLKNGFIRNTSMAFVEDPLRVLRGMQFAARFDFKVTSETAELCQSMFDTYDALAKERVWVEWEKWATKSIKPSAGIRFLDQTGWLKHFPQIEALKGVPQDPIWHPEGDVFEHTMHVVDAAAQIAKDFVPEERLLTVMAALCHDFGKVTNTSYFGEWSTRSDGTPYEIEGTARYRSHGHEAAGEKPTRLFLENIGAPQHLIAKIVPLVTNHLAHCTFQGEAPTPRSVRRLAVRLHPATIDQLIHVIHADAAGRPPLSQELPTTAVQLQEMAKQVRVADGRPKPIVMGRDLLKAGIRPGPEMGRILSKLYELQLDGAFDNVEDGLTTLNNLKVT
jgi:tRNA nucleotidyltransferase (CCA-adding enzyme)